MTTSSHRQLATPEEQLRRLRHQINWVTRISVAPSSVDRIEDVISTVIYGLLAPTGLGYSQALVFQHHMADSLLTGKFAVRHESLESFYTLAQELEDETAYMQERVENAQDSEEDLHWLAGNAQWVTLLQKLGLENERTDDLRRLQFGTFANPADTRSGHNIFHQVCHWRRPRILSKSALGTALPHVLAVMLPERFIIAPLTTSRGLRALLILDRHLEPDIPFTAQDTEDLEWFCRQASVSIENVEINSELAMAFQELKQVDLMKTNFLSIISHELRTPLTAMTGFVELVLDGRVGPVNENQRTLLSRVSKNTHHLNHLVNDLIELAEIEAAGTLDARRDPIEPLAVLLDCLPKLEQRRREKQVKVIPLVECDVPRIIGDERGLERIFFHLLDNAMKFSTDGASVEVVMRTEGDELFIDVRDHGMGIAPENIQNIFKHFYQVDNTLTRGHEGLGLGLAVTKMLVQANRGRILVSSELGHGSTFTVVFPIYRGSGGGY